MRTSTFSPTLAFIYPNQRKPELTTYEKLLFDFNREFYRNWISDFIPVWIFYCQSEF